MLPTVPNHARVLTLRIPVWLFRPGMLVVAEVEPALFVVKRVAAILNNDSLELASDNPSTTSKYCGVPISKQQISGWVIRISKCNTCRYGRDQTV